MTQYFKSATGLFALLSLLLAALSGCGDSGPSTSVYGKVTVNGQPAIGTIHFVGADGKEASAPIGPTGGTYTVANPPLGEVTVLFKGAAAAAAPAPMPPPGAMEMPGGTMKAKGSEGVPPPAKYADAAGGIKYTVTSGKQQKDFELTP